MYLLKTNICNEQNNEIVPQVSHLGYGYDYEAADSATRIVVNEPLDFTPNLKSFCLRPETKATDIIQQGYIYTAGLLLSEALYNSIQNYALQPHRAYETQVVYNNLHLNYYWIHITKMLEGEIDYQRSEFFQTYDSGLPTIRRFLDREELSRQSRELVNSLSGNIIAKKIVFLNNDFLYDLFFLKLTSKNIYISETVKDCLLKKQFTGFEILPSPTLFIV